ncbi:MAG TPA: hypothetical protein VFL55_13020 [Acetobacteraceae bacterium]|jgi:hypothetical protein|nr:hypothetical protein [Acetobacteraceae bacterium]
MKSNSVRLSEEPGPYVMLPAPKWLELAAEIRGLADAAQSPEVRSALSELAFCYTAFAAGLDASNEPPRERITRRQGAYPLHIPG